MLQIKNIYKRYVTGELLQTALDNVSLNLRDNEFVAILGPSGSGKTTLLNIIGGLDHYDDGDLIINGVSTRMYREKDWNSFRNHTIGFVFQSYNLIPHQSILSNVELALTISGMSKKERKKRAKEALDKVGLLEQAHKKPNQMSGGQMQRVAIARALVNDPDILLADEPTGALDTETSIQVMNLLKEVAKDRLVVMVTHNAELAEEFATRIIRLRDGRVINDTDPLVVDQTTQAVPKHQNMGKSSMSFRTALSLSFNNLRTKKGRTILTSFAGSIGIIGIALILSISTGVNNYIDYIQKDTMTSYPIVIEAKTMDLASMFTPIMMDMGEKNEGDAVYSNATDMKMKSYEVGTILENNLSAFKKYLDNPESEIHEFVGDNGINYSYDLKFDVYSYDPEGELVNTNGSTLMGNQDSEMEMMAMSSMMMSSSNVQEAMAGKGDALISDVVMDNYQLVHGNWPKNYDEVLLVLNGNNEISSAKLYELGVLPASEYREIMEQMSEGEEIDFESHQWSYEELSERPLYMVPASAYYVEEEGKFKNLAEEEFELEDLVKGSLQLKITGVIRPTEDASDSSLTTPIAYTKALTDYIIQVTEDSAVVKAQKESTEINVLSGMSFAPEDDQAKIEDTKEYLLGLSISEKAQMLHRMLRLSPESSAEEQAAMSEMGEAELAMSLDAFVETAEDSVLLMIYEDYISPGSYDDNMKAFGMVSLDAPSTISIYTDSFEGKDEISKAIDVYNETAKDEDQITYTDYIGFIMQSVTDIVDVISYVLIAFVAVSLVVSSIMIGIITYISVLERTKEIGILRAIGASKGNISQVFNAETFIVGAFSGFIGIGITWLLIIPGNLILHLLIDSSDVSATLPLTGSVILVVLSIILTLIGGIIPSRMASKKDPVVALRSE